LRPAIANIGYQGCGKYPEYDSCRYDLYKIGHYLHKYGTGAKCDIGNVCCANNQQERGDNRSERRGAAAERRGGEGVYFE
jgi:hypothetical protein